MNSLRLCAFVGAIGTWLLAAGCSSTNDAAPRVIPTTATADVPAQGRQLETMSSTTTSFVGQVDYMTFFTSSHEFHVKTSDGTSYWVLASSSTQWTDNGLTLKVGDWISADGALSSSGIVAASSITLSSTQPPALAGQLAYMTFFSGSHEFAVKTSTGAYYWILTSSSTLWNYNGETLKVGDSVSANGAWKSSTTLAASSVTLGTSAPSPTPGASPTPESSPTPGPPANVPNHVQTAEYLWSATEVATNPSAYQPYLSWAYTNYARAGLTQAAGIKIALYTSPIMPAANTYEFEQLNGTYASDRATTCTGSLVTTYNGTGLLSDPTKSSAAAYFQNIVNNAVSTIEAANPGYSHPWDLIFIDNDGPLYGASATPCNFTPATWGAAQDAALATTGQKFILNSLSVADDNVPTFVQRLGGSAIEGGEFEECFMTALWSSEEDAQLQSIALLKSEGKPGGAGFWYYADNTLAPGAAYIPERMYIYASFLLTYDPSYSVFQESFTTTPSTFSVFPETGFVPMEPVSVPAGVSSLLTSTGAYMQQYDYCYYRGSLLGRCEIIANPSTTASVSVPNPWGLQHSMVLSGGGVLDGGSASFTGSVPLTMGPRSGVILTP